MDRSYKVCRRCVMDNGSDKTITFLGNGTCNYCNDTLNRMGHEYFPNSTGKKLLDNIIAQIKKDGEEKQYHCMVGLSGGVDSSYIIYLGYKYGLRMLAVHIDDDLDAEVARQNIKYICEKTKTDIVMVKPDLEQYKDLIRSFFLARVPNIALPQDNIIATTLNDTARKYDLKYSLSGVNFAQESILERSTGVNAFDKRHIIAIHKQFGRASIDRLPLTNFYKAYIYNRYLNRTTKVLPLNYVDYNLQNVLGILADFCGYNYYGGKH